MPLLSKNIQDKVYHLRLQRSLRRHVCNSRPPFQAGLFVGWSLKTLAALTAAVLQSWLGGLVSKRPGGSGAPSEV